MIFLPILCISFHSFLKSPSIHLKQTQSIYTLKTNTQFPYKFHHIHYTQASLFQTETQTSETEACWRQANYVNALNLFIQQVCGLVNMEKPHLLLDLAPARHPDIPAAHCAPYTYKFLCCPF